MTTKFDDVTYREDESVGQGPTIIHFCITLDDYGFAKSILLKEPYAELLSIGEIRLSIALEKHEIPSFRVHPLYGDSRHYMAVLKRAGVFNSLAYDKSVMADRIIKFYQIYLDPVVITSAEVYLWKMFEDSKAVVSRIASSLGFPIGAELIQIKSEKRCSAYLDDGVWIKAILEVSGVRNSIRDGIGVEFLLSIRKDMGGVNPRAWLETLAPPSVL